MIANQRDFMPEAGKILNRVHLEIKEGFVKFISIFSFAWKISLYSFSPSPVYPEIQNTPEIVNLSTYEGSNWWQIFVLISTRTYGHIFSLKSH